MLFSTFIISIASTRVLAAALPLKGSAQELSLRGPPDMSGLNIVEKRAEDVDVDDDDELVVYAWNARVSEEIEKSS
ncbi:hypothetical protein F4821DRAFT_252648 [Hypoxylon rubiginosum]|uniref:Uncharacterized protein n=1 Tax=Hypoxylon rubiginosum TaxID=110542 RepID=A0ACC0DL90_9PEZI|nr:hypothetical protein F4821DRAFT_252648 [Hypoxylon rubiginosum]